MAIPSRELTRRERMILRYLLELKISLTSPTLSPDNLPILIVGQNGILGHSILLYKQWQDSFYKK